MALPHSVPFKAWQPKSSCATQVALFCCDVRGDLCKILEAFVAKGSAEVYHRLTSLASQVGLDYTCSEPKSPSKTIKKSEGSEGTKHSSQLIFI